MNFKRNLLKKSIILLVLILLAGTAFASSGDTINIGGVVPLILDLTVAPTAISDNLTLAGAATITALNIADITVTTNNSAGWELWIYSENDSNLLNADGDNVVYTLTYSGATGALPDGTDSPLSTGVQFGEEGDASGDIAELGINYTQTTGFPAGYYADQLTLVLRAK